MLERIDAETALCEARIKQLGKLRSAIVRPIGLMMKAQKSIDDAVAAMNTNALFVGERMVVPAGRNGSAHAAPEAAKEKPKNAWQVVLLCIDDSGGKPATIEDIKLYLKKYKYASTRSNAYTNLNLLKRKGLARRNGEGYVRQ